MIRQIRHVNCYSRRISGRGIMAFVDALCFLGNVLFVVNRCLNNANHIENVLPPLETILGLSLGVAG